MDTRERIEILRELDLGSGVAQHEEWCEATEAPFEFVETRAFELLKSGRRDLILGPKGSGKSALAMRLMQDDTRGELEARGVLLIQAENPKGATAFSKVLELGEASEPILRKVWQKYLVELIATTLRERGIENRPAKKLFEVLIGAADFETFRARTLGERLNAAVNSVMKRSPKVEAEIPVTGDAGKVTLTLEEEAAEHESVISINKLIDLADDALCEAGLQAWVAFDRLDSVFSDAPALEFNALRALLRLAQDFQSKNGLRLILFLRDDIKERITRGGFTELDQAFAKAVEVKWNADDLIDLMARRFAESDRILTAYELSKVEVTGSLVVAKGLIERILPERVEGKRTLEWLFNNLRDASPYPNHPRDLIVFFGKAIEEQLYRSSSLDQESHQAEENLFAPTAVLEGLAATSRARLSNNLHAEYPHLRNEIDALTGTTVPLDRQTLGELWGMDDPRKISSVILELLSAGVIAAGDDVFTVAPIYVPALRIKTSDARS